MKKKYTTKLSTFFILFALVFSANQTFGQIVLSQETAAQYVEKIVGNNVEWSNATIIGSSDAIASFTGGESGGLHNMESGVMLSTGSLASSDALEGSAIIFSSTDMGTDGIAELTAMTGMQTYDGIILQFDVVPATDQLIINYQFGSEEYNQWVNTSYTDQMAIFISGPGFDTSGENIATGPNGTLINSNTINRGTLCPSNPSASVSAPGTSCGIGTGNCATNPMYYIDNCTGMSNAMNGFTLMLSAIAPYVIPNETYTIRIMIADIGDAEYDSWVILQENGIYSGSEEASNSVFGKDSFTAYPNPVRDIFTISYNTQITGIEVTNMLGQTVISKTTNSNDVHIDMSALPMGNYLVKVKANEINKTLKVVKQ